MTIGSPWWLWQHQLRNSLREAWRDMVHHVLCVVDGNPRPGPPTWSIYLYGGRVVIPHAIGEIGGAIMDVEPFSQLDLASPNLSSELTGVFQRQNLTLVRRWDDRYKSDPKHLLRATGSRSWKRLYSEGQFWSVDKGRDGFTVTRWKPSQDHRGQEPDLDRTVSVPNPMDLSELVSFMEGEFRN